MLMPALALGLSQKDFGNLKDLENHVLKLGEKLIPPSTSYTQSTQSGEPVQTDIDEGGRPTKEDGEKAEVT
jgi:hypothetical protein